MTTRYQSLTHWLTQQMPYTALHPMPGDASARRYYRLEVSHQGAKRFSDGVLRGESASSPLSRRSANLLGAGNQSQEGDAHIVPNSCRLETDDAKTYLVMDHPPEAGSCQPFVALSHYLRSQGSSVPRIIADTIAQGFVLLEDFGDQLYQNQLCLENARLLYQMALNELLVFHVCPPKPCGEVVRFDQVLIDVELNGFSEWYLQGYLKRNLSKAEHAVIHDAAQWLGQEILKQPQVFMHRDYHSRNLIMKPDQTVGVIDFQDAMIGPVTYDVVSLLRDCYVDWPEALVTACALYYKQLAYKHNLLADTVTDTEFLRWFDITGIERHLKAIFTFSRKAGRDQDESYLRYLPRTLQYLHNIMPKFSELDKLYDLIFQEQAE